MNQLLKPAVACLAVLGMFGMQGLCAQDDPDRPAALQLTTNPSGHSLHIDGDAAALHVVVQQTTIADVLSALAGFNVRYRSSIALDEMRDGSYAGVRSTGQCNTACSLSAGVSKPKVFRGR